MGEDGTIAAQVPHLSPADIEAVVGLLHDKGSDRPTV
jgi:hypothetical protein